MEPGFEYYLNAVLLYVLCAVLLSLTVVVWYATVVLQFVSSHCRMCCYMTLLFSVSISLLLDYGLLPILTAVNNVAVKILVGVLMRVAKNSSRTSKEVPCMGVWFVYFLKK